MKIKIKSREEIKKTLSESNHHIDNSGAYFNKDMFKHCGKIFEAKPYGLYVYSVMTEDKKAYSGTWCWHSDWYEVLEPDFTEEDLMDIELMDEMLAYFIESK